MTEIDAFKNGSLPAEGGASVENEVPEEVVEDANVVVVVNNPNSDDPGTDPGAVEKPQNQNVQQDVIVVQPEKGDVKLSLQQDPVTSIFLDSPKKTKRKRTSLEKFLIFISFILSLGLAALIYLLFLPKGKIENSFSKFVNKEPVAKEML